MENLVPDVEIPVGFTRFRMICGIPLALCFVLCSPPILCAYLVGFLWALAGLPVLALLWAFAAYHTKRDPTWMEAWAFHVQLADVYYG